MNRHKLATWIRAHARAASARWALRQVVTIRGSEELSRVCEWPSDIEPDELATAALAAAKEDADAIGGQCHYGLFAIGEDEMGAARKVWRVAGEAFTDDMQPAETPDARGLVGQLMRHQEVDRRIVTQGQGELLEHYRKALEEARERIQYLEAREVENIKLMGELVRARSEDRKAERDQELAHDLKRRAAGKLELLVPPLLSKLGGPKMLPAGPTADGLRALLLSLKPEQMMAMTSHLTPEQQTAFAALWEEADALRGTVASTDKDDPPSAPAAAE